MSTDTKADVTLPPEPAGSWVPVAERSPWFNGTYTVWRPNEAARKADWSNKGWRDDNDSPLGQFTHWQPQPEHSADAAQKRIAELSAKCDAAMGALDEMCDALGIPADGRADGPSATAALAQARAEGLEKGIAWCRNIVILTESDRQGAVVSLGRVATARLPSAPIEDDTGFLAAVEARDKQARAGGFREGVEKAATVVRGVTGDVPLEPEARAGREYVADAVLALLPSADAGPVAARWATRPVEERKALLADALAGEGDVTAGLPKGGSDGE